MHSILCCRVVLHIRGAAKTHDSHTDATTSVASATVEFRRVTHTAISSDTALESVGTRASAEMPPVATGTTSQV